MGLRRFKLDVDYVDLRAYLAVLWRWKWLIVICVVLATAAAAIVTYLIPPTYEAAALVVTTKPIYQLQFDPRITSQDNPLPLKTAKTTHELLAKDPALVQQIIDTLGEALAPESRSPAQVEGWLDVREVSNEGVIRLVVSHTDPETAWLIADTWARLYAERLNQLYGQTVQDVTVIATQLETARKSLDVAQTGLSRFHQRSRLPSLEKQLEVRRNTLGTYLSTQDRLDLIIEDAQLLRTQIQKANVPGLDLATQLAFLYLKLGSLSVESPPITLQIPVDQAGFTAASPADQLCYLDEFITASQGKKASLGTRITQLEGEISSLSAEVETESATLNQLALARDVAFETFGSLSRKVDEMQVSVELGGGVAQVAGAAVWPEDPVSSNLLRNVGLAAVGGLLLGVGGAFALEYASRWPQAQPVDEQTGTIGEI